MSATSCPEGVLWRVTAEADIEKGLRSASRTDGGGEEWAREAHGSGQECPPRTSAIDDSDLWFYRDRTVVLLKRYMRMAVQTGRLPSVLGRECFRARVTRYSMTSFEDMSIFVHDVEMALRSLNVFQQQLIGLSVLEDYELLDVARLLRTPLRTVERELPEALDELSRIFLAKGLMIEMASG